MSVRCRWCDEGSEAERGWHYEPGDGPPRQPCSVAPPRSAKIITDASTLTRDEMDALLLVGEVFGPVVLDTTEVDGGDFL